MRKCSMALVLLFLLQVLTVGALAAHPVPDMGAGGSITVTLKTRDKGRAEGGTLTFTQVAEIVEDDGDYSFALTPAFAPSGLDLAGVGTPELAEALAAFAREHDLAGDTLAVENGGAVYEVPAGRLGIYLVSQEKACDRYHKLDPFLIGVPNLEEEGYSYRVDAAPKMGELDRKPEEHKEDPPPTPTPTPPPQLRQTGQLNWPVPILAGSGLVLLSTGWLLRRRGREDEEE